LAQTPEETGKQLAAVRISPQTPYRIVSRDTSVVVKKGEIILKRRWLYKVGNSEGGAILSSFPFSYAKGVQEIKIPVVRFYAAGGEQVKLKVEIEDRPAYPEKRYDHYKNHRQKVVGFPTLEPGMGLELEIETLTRRGAPFWHCEVFADVAPMDRCSLSLSTEPGAVPLVVTELNGAKRQLTSAPEETWTSRDCPVSEYLEFAPPECCYRPTVALSDPAGWEKLAVSLANAQPSSQKALALLPSSEQDIKSIFYAFSARMKPVTQPSLGLDLGAPDVEGITLSSLLLPCKGHDVEKTGIGLPLDLANLLAAFLNAAGHKSYPAIAFPVFPALQSDAQLTYLNIQAIVAVRDGEAWRYLLPRDTTHRPYALPPELVGARVLILKPDSPEWQDLKATDCDLSPTVQEAIGSLSSPNGVLNASVTLSGGFENVARLRETYSALPGADRLATLEKSLRTDAGPVRVSDASFENLQNRDKEPLVRYSFAQTGWATEIDDRLIFFPKLIQRALKPRKPESARESPYVFVNSSESRTILHIRTGDNYVAETLPADVIITTPFADYKRSLRMENGLLQIEVSLKFKAAQLDASAREQVNDFFLRTALAERAQVVLVRRR
jgi:hypothetical protein